MSKQTGTQVYKRLLKYTSQYWFMFILAFFSTAVFVFIETELVAGFEGFIDRALNGDDEFLMALPYYIVGAVLIRGIASFFSTYCFEWIGRKTVHAMRVELFDKYLQMPMTFFDQENQGNLVSKITFNAETVAQAATQAVSKILTSGGMIIYAIYNMMEISFSLTMTFLITAPAIAFVVNVTAKRFRRLSHSIQDSMGQVTQLSQEMVEGIRVVKTFDGQSYEKESFHQSSNLNRQQSMKMTTTKAFSSPLIQIMGTIGLAFVFWIAAQQYLEGLFTAGKFVAFFSLVMYIMKPLKDLSNLNSVLQKGIAGAQSIFDVIDSDNEKDLGTKVIERSEGAIHFDHVSFSYNPQNPTIEQFDLKIKPGQTVALVGPSGSGKSTVMNLLLSFYHPDSGKIYLDGEDINELTLMSLRKQFSLVSQQITLFNDTIRNNIAYGELANKSEEALQDAIDSAYLRDVIDELDDGLETNVGNQGSRLSGGQRQRIAIARALLKDAPILILDEATSALDNESEKKIQNALKKLMKGRTTLVVAHRLSTIESADIIVVLKQGRIVEQGTHEELLQRSGEYKRLYEVQLSE